jgi:hypothetical protein
MFETSSNEEFIAFEDILSAEILSEIPLKPDLPLAKQKHAPKLLEIYNKKSKKIRIKKKCYSPCFKKSLPTISIENEIVEFKSYFSTPKCKELTKTESTKKKKIDFVSFEIKNTEIISEEESESIIS